MCLIQYFLITLCQSTPFLPNPFAECQPYLRKVPQQVKDGIFDRIWYEVLKNKN